MSLFNPFGILGINARNLQYIRPYNPKKAVRLADDKLKTKHFLSARGVPVPKLYAVIRNQDDLKNFDFNSLPSAFVLKPNLGFGGEGIIPIIGRKEASFIKSSGMLISKEEMAEHIGDILEGRFSISGTSDTAFFEQLIVCDDQLGKFAYKGLPDLRIVVHNLIPVMAMLRLPTKESDGKANLHQGALGVGIDIARGTVTHVVLKGKIIDEVPEVGSIRGLKIPYWEDILMAASRVQLATNLGYLAADMAIDRNVGPVLLEINARAGLGVQIANLAPLKRRLERIQGIKVQTPEKGVRIAQELFGNRVEKEVKKMTGKQVIGSQERVDILLEGETRHAWASVNPLLERSLIHQDFAKELNLEAYEENPSLVKLKLSLAGKRWQTLARLEDLSGKNYDLVLGRRDLQSFFIDPSKDRRRQLKLPALKKEDSTEDRSVPYLEWDRRLISIDRQLKLLHHLKPLNLKDEGELFLKNPEYNPQFIYPESDFDIYHLKEKIQHLDRELDDSPLGQLFRGKLREIELKVSLLGSLGSDRFKDYSAQLYGIPDLLLLEEAKKKLSSQPKSFKNVGRLMDLPEVISEFEHVLKEYDLSSWKIKIKKSMVADCLAGKGHSLFLREGAKFSADRLRMVIAHEIETHILTAENGRQQGYQLFNQGFGNYLETQEGLAIWNQEMVVKQEHSKKYVSALLVLIVDFAWRHSFAETVDYCMKLGMSLNKAFRKTLRVKRGMEDTKQTGALTKDILYFKGFQQVQSFVGNGGDLKDLYYGKYNLSDLTLIKALPHLNAPKHIPHFLRV
jgi:alpha-L-glutamate ligase-like protein/uncharacterized protein (TIGR02421 family)